jgi:hypothetical protein
MKTGQASENAKAKRLAGLYNMVPNLLWSALSLAPVSIFCYTQFNINLLFLFVGVSILPAFLSNSIIDKMQIASRAAIYKKLGVGFIQRLSQNGAIVNSRIRRKYSTYKTIRLDQKSIKGLFLRTYVFERFHLTLFVFFCLTGFYALSKGFTNWAAVIFLLNVVYNVYPILLQQFIRTKLALHITKNNKHLPVANTVFPKHRLKCMGQAKSNSVLL